MGIQLTLTLSKTSINLGETVTVDYSSIGAANSVLSTDNTVTPIGLGLGNVNGTMSFLPTASGSYTIIIYGMNNDADAESVTAVCWVN